MTWEATDNEQYSFSQTIKIFIQNLYKKKQQKKKHLNKTEKSFHLF